MGNIIKTNAVRGLAELYGKNFTSSAEQIILKVLEFYTDDEVRLACEWIVRDGIERMPTPIAIKRKCDEVRAWNRKNEPAHDLLCTYREQAESMKSRSLCCTVTQEDAEVSELQGWGILCKWHYDVRYCEHFPGSVRQKFVASMLKELPYKEQMIPKISEHDKEWLLSDVEYEPATTPQGYWF